MGGHSSGEVASLFAMRTIREFYERTVEGEEGDAALRSAVPAWPFERRQPEHREERRLVQSVLLANEVIHAYAAKRPDCKGMGTTWSAPTSSTPECTSPTSATRGPTSSAATASSGSPRTTASRTSTSAWASSSPKSEFFPYRNVITRARPQRDRRAEVHFFTIQPDDLYVFCSDRLTDPLTDEEILRITIEHRDDLEVACANSSRLRTTRAGPTTSPSSSPRRPSKRTRAATGELPLRPPARQRSAARRAV